MASNHWSRVRTGCEILIPKEPQDALRQCILIQEPSLFMFWDLHVDFEDPLVLRQIRDLCLSITPKQQALIFLSPF